MQTTLRMHKGGLTTRNKQRTTLPRRVVILIDIQESEKPSVKYVFCQEWRNCNMWPLRHFGSWCTVMEKEFSDKHRVTDVEGTIASWALWRDVPILYEQSAFPEVARLVFCRWP